MDRNKENERRMKKRENGIKVTVVGTCKQSQHQLFLFELTPVKWRFTSRLHLYHNHISSLKRSCTPSRHINQLFKIVSLSPYPSNGDI
jgi:hypothetical protein